MPILYLVYFLSLFHWDSPIIDQTDVINNTLSYCPTKIDKGFIQKKVGYPYIGMTIDELKQNYKDATIKEEPVSNYGVDGESNGLLIIENEEPLFFAWTLLNSNNVKGITVLSPKMIIDSNVHVGMKINEFVNKYPDAILGIDMIDDRIEFSYIFDKKYRIEFLTTDSTRVGNYDYEIGEPEFINLRRPEATVDRISLN